MAPGIALATTLHDTEGLMAPLVAERAATLSSLFNAVCAVATEATAEATLRSIEAIPRATVARKPGRWTAKMGRGRRLAATMAVQEGEDFILHLDLDRLLHWVRAYPDELAAMLNDAVPSHDFLIIGRSARAFGTHPDQQRGPESLTNDAISAALGREVDVTAGSSSFRREVGIALLAGSVSDDFATTDTEWPLLALMSGFSVSAIEAEGLEFETPDLHAGRIAEIGYRAWLEELFDEAQLSYRHALARASIEIIEATLARYGARRQAGGAAK